MKGFDARFLEELKSKNDIIDVIGRYIHLEQKGANFWGRCPFHHEKTASFCVNPINQFYYCFGCHKSGDVISFIEEMESLDFGDAVKYLADRVKMQLPEVKYDDEQVKAQKRKKERALALLKDTALFYVSNLKKPQAEKHIEYILKRKISSETVVKFGLGASLDFNGLVEHLRGLGYTYEEMVSSGAVGEKNGRYFDWLGGRLIIPVIDQFNNVVAFDGRRIDGEKEQKYINTKETFVFFKGKTLFNINNLKKVKNEKGINSVIIVEGHLDVVSLSQAGFTNVVASMGTALTKDQARVIKRYAEKVLICYDGDFAGQKAAIRGLEILGEEGLDVKVVSLPDGMDPDDVVTKLGNEKFQQCLDLAMPLIDFKLDILKKTFDLNSVDGKRKFVSNAVRVIKESSSPTEQEDLLKTVRNLTGFTFESLKRELYSIDDKAPEIKEKIVQIEENDKSGDKIIKATRFILYSYLFNKKYVSDIDIKEFDFTEPVYNEIKEYIIAQKEENKSVNFSDLFEVELSDAGELSKIAEMETGFDVDRKKAFDEETYFNDSVKTILLASIEKKMELLTSRYSAEKDVEVRKEIANNLNELIKEKKKLI